MKINEIFALEHSESTPTDNGSIHLLRDRSFFQAYEYSAFYMERFFRKYKVHSRFFKNINAEMVYMGFPERCMEPLQREVDLSGYLWIQVDENRVDIQGLPPCKDFEEWKTTKISMIEGIVPSRESFEQEQIEIPYENLMLANREAYDICLYVCRCSSKFFRNFRFGLGEKLRQESVELTEHLHLVSTSVVKMDSLLLRTLMGSMRIKVRLLSDLGQINGEQWFFFNEKVEKIYSLLRLESCRSKDYGSKPARVGDQLA